MDITERPVTTRTRRELLGGIGSLFKAISAPEYKGITAQAPAVERQHISRRSFLARAALLTGMIGGGSFGLDTAIKILFGGAAETSMDARRSEVALNAIYPGFMETEVRAAYKAKRKQVPEFITLKKGHLSWLKAMTTHPVINATARAMIERMDKTSIPPQLTKAGDTLQSFIEEATKQLTTRNSRTDPAMLRTEALHAAILSSAAVMNNAIGLHSFGYQSSRWGSNDYDAQWGANGFSRNSFPSLFTGQRTATDVESYGKDRAMHFFNHMALTYQMLYASNHNLPERYESPLQLNLKLDLAGQAADAFAAAILGNTLVGAFANLTGLAYEGKSLANPATYPPELRRLVTGDASTTEPDSGAFDPEVMHDLTANYLGQLCGAALFNGHTDEVIALLNDERLLEVTTSPSIPDDMRATLLAMI
jgi:hypothetical protein